MQRGQTTLDFAVGVSIFLFSIVFVFGFVPGTLQPFTESAQDETAGSDRVADLVVKDLLAEAGEPYVLDGRCTATLLSDGAGTGCEFDGGNLSTRLDLPPSQSINITMRGNPSGSGTERLCWDPGSESVVGVSAGDASCVAFATGDTPPTNSDSVVTARRVVSIDGTGAVVEVRLW